MSEKSTGGEEASHANIWGTVVQAEDTVGAKALRHTALGVLKGQRGSQCGWSRLSTERMRGQSDGVGSSSHRPHSPLEGYRLYSGMKRSYWGF